MSEDPITFEPIKDPFIKLDDFNFNIDSLYNFFLKSLDFRHPITRTSITREQLQKIDELNPLVDKTSLVYIYDNLEKFKLEQKFLELEQITWQQDYDSIMHTIIICIIFYEQEVSIPIMMTNLIELKNLFSTVYLRNKDWVHEHITSALMSIMRPFLSNKKVPTKGFGMAVSFIREIEKNFFNPSKIIIVKNK